MTLPHISVRALLPLARHIQSMVAASVEEASHVLISPFSACLPPAAGPCSGTVPTTVADPAGNDVGPAGRDRSPVSSGASETREGGMLTRPDERIEQVTTAHRAKLAYHLYPPVLGRPGAAAPGEYERSIVWSTVPAGLAGRASGSR